MRESEIQTKIKNLLTDSGWLVIKIIQSNYNGICDLMALKDGRAVFIEVKAPGKKPSPLQLHRHQQLRKCGFEVVVADKVEDISHLIK